MKKRKALMTLVFVGAASLPFLVSASGNTTKQQRPNRVAFKNAIESGDYQTFKNLTSGLPKPSDAPEITEEIFQKLVEAHKLRKAGDKEGALKIMTELGLKKPAHAHMGKFFSTLTDTQKETLKQAKKLAVEGKVEEAQKLLTDAGIKIPEHKGPFLGEAHPQFANLTDAQKEIMKEARTLITDGKLTEAKTLLQNAGIPTSHTN